MHNKLSKLDLQLLTVMKHINLVKKGSCLILSTLLLSSCATIISGTSPSIHIDGNNPEPVTITTSYQTYENVNLPQVVKVKRKKLDGQRIQITSPNYDYKDIVLKKTVNGWTFGNILLGGLIGWGVDLGTNAVSKPKQDTFHVSPTPKEKAN